MSNSTTQQLSKIDSKGKHRVWYAIRVGNTYTTHAGVADGKHIEKEYTITKPKGKNTPEEQAEKDMRSKERKKYERELYSYDLTKPHPHAFTQPMLAHDATKVGHRIDWKGREYSVQPKLNGVRCTAKADGAYVTLTSRKGKLYVVPHIQQALYTQVFINNPDMELDGELYIHGTELGDITHAVAHGDSLLEYHVFDKTNGTDVFVDRYHDVQSLNLQEPLYTVDTSPILVPEKLDILHDTCVADGYEGIILRDNESVYENKRSLGLFKYKKFKDSEFVVAGVTPDSDGGAILVLKTVTGQFFNSRPMGSNQYRKNLLINASNVIGKMVTVRYSTLLESGVPEFNRTLQGGVLRDYE